MASDYCPVARRPTLRDLAFGHFRARGGVWEWIPPIKVRGYMELIADPRPLPASLLAKAICCLALLLAGCTSPAPPAKPDLRPWIATSGMISLMAPSPAPLPPAPTPGAKCESCRGTGIVGDSVVGVKCQKCDGTGVVPTRALPVPSAGVPAPVSTLGAPSVPMDGDDAPTFRIICEDGKCRRIRIAPPSR